MRRQSCEPHARERASYHLREDVLVVLAQLRRSLEKCLGDLYGAALLGIARRHFDAYGTIKSEKQTSPIEKAALFLGCFLRAGLVLPLGDQASSVTKPGLQSRQTLVTRLGLKGRSARTPDTKAGKVWLPLGSRVGNPRVGHSAFQDQQRLCTHRRHCTVSQCPS